MPLILIVAALLLSACAGSRKVTYDTVDIIQADSEVPEHQLLDIGILIFDPGVAEDQEGVDGNVFPDVRRAEARYMPYHLKKTLESTGMWGSVWVLPEHSDAVIGKRPPSQENEGANRHRCGTLLHGHSRLQLAVPPANRARTDRKASGDSLEFAHAASRWRD